MIFALSTSRGVIRYEFLTPPVWARRIVRPHRLGAGGSPPPPLRGGGKDVQRFAGEESFRRFRNRRRDRCPARAPRPDREPPCRRDSRARSGRSDPPTRETPLVR